MKIKELSKNILLLFIILVLFFSFLEVGVRIFASENKRTLRFDESLGMMRIPSIEFKKKSREFGWLFHRTNSLGFVDSEHKLEKDENVYRIIFLGDSWTEALQVSREKTFWNILGEKLNEQYPDKKIEVISLGLDGIATGKEYLLLKEIGLKYSPDLVILMFYAGNDIIYNSLSLSNDPTEPYFDIENNSLKQIKNPEPFIQNKLISLLTQNFQSPRFLYGKIDLLKIRIESFKNKIDINNSTFPDLFNIYKKEYNADWNQAWQITNALIREMKIESEAKKTDFLLVNLPDSVQVYSNLWESTLSAYPAMKNVEWDLEKPSRILNEFSQQENINYLDLLPIFRQYVAQTGQDLYLDHFNSQGHQLTADSIYKFLIDNNLLVGDRSI